MLHLPDFCLPMALQLLLFTGIVHFLQFRPQPLNMFSPDPGICALLSNNLTIQHLEHPMGKVLQIDIMGDHDQSYFFSLVKFQQNVKNNVRVSRIQIPCRLIQEQNLWFVG